MGFLLAILLSFLSNVLYADSMLEQRQWVLQAAQDSQGNQLELTPNQGEISFAEGQVSASVGCNHIFATYELINNQMDIRDLGQTMMHCEGNVGEFEAQFITILTAVNFYEVLEEGGLVLQGTAGQLIFQKPQATKAPNSEIGLTSSEWIYNGSSDGLVTSMVLDSGIKIRFSDNEISGNAGCNQFYGQYKTQDDQFTMITISATTRKLCDDATMQEEQKFLKQLGQSERFSIDDAGQLTLSTIDGKTLVFKP